MTRGLPISSARDVVTESKKAGETNKGTLFGVMAVAVLFWRMARMCLIKALEAALEVSTVGPDGGDRGGPVCWDWADAA